MGMEKFSNEFNGYNRQEVNQFLSDTIKQLEGMLQKAEQQDKILKEQYTKIAEQTKTIQSLQEKLVHYQSIESTLQKALFQAEESSNNIKRMAQEQANLIIQEARQNANRIVNDSLLRSEKIELQADTLDRNLRIFKKKLRLVVEQQLAVVEEIEDLELN